MTDLFSSMENAILDSFKRNNFRTLISNCYEPILTNAGFKFIQRKPSEYNFFLKILLSIE